MSSKFLDKTGLDTLWAKIKSTFQTLGNLVTAWGSTPSDTKYPSEKLVKASLDAKAPNAVTTEAAIATGDKLLFSDASDSSKTKRMSTGFDTGLPTTVLKRSGVFEAVKEADVIWGGSFRSELSPAEFGNMARNLIHNPITTAITFDKSTDGGTTWVSQTVSDALKRALCNLAGGGAGSNFGIPNSAYSGISDPSLLQGRITVYAISGPDVTTAESTWFYGIVKRILMKVSRSGSAKMKVEYQTWPHFIADDGIWGVVGTFDVQGNSGWNSIPFDNTLGGYRDQLSGGRIISIRFTFWIASGSTPRISIINLGFLPQIHWSSNAGNIPLLGVPVFINDDGTGVINAASKLQTSRKLAVSLSNTSTDTSFNGSADVTNIKTTGTLPITNGGTGQTGETAAQYALLNPKCVELTAALADNYRIMFASTDPSASVGLFVGYRKASAFWTYIKDKISSVLGLTATSYGGNAATAAGYTSGGAIDTALQGKATPADITSAIQALDVASQGGDGKYIKAISEVDGKISATAETMDTTPTASSTKAVTSGGVRTALDGKQDDLGISSRGDADKFLNEKGEWATPTGSGVTGVKGDAETNYRTGNVNLSSEDLGMGTFYDLESSNAILFSIGDTTNYGSIKFFASVGGYVIEFTVTVVVNSSKDFTETPAVTMYACRLSGQTLGSSNLVPSVKYLAGDSSTPAKLWVYFGSGNVKRIRWLASSQNYKKITSSEVTIASIDSSASMVAATSYNYLPIVIGGFNKAVGNPTQPVYVDARGVMTECTSVNADTVDGFHFSTSTSGSATNTVYLV